MNMSSSLSRHQLKSTSQSRDELFHINHIHYVYKNMIKDDLSSSLRHKAFYIHNVHYTRQVRISGVTLVETKEQIAYMIKKAMGGIVVNNQKRARYIVCDDLNSPPKLAPIRGGQYLISSDYIYNRFFNKNISVEHYESPLFRSSQELQLRKYKHRLKIDSTRFLYSPVVYPKVSNLIEQICRKSRLYGPIGEEFSSEKISDDEQSVFGSVVKVKRFIDCIIETIITDMYEDGSFTIHDTPSRDETGAPIVLVIQVTNNLYNTFVSRGHRQLLEMVGDALLSATQQVDNYIRLQACAVLSNGLEFQFAALEKIDSGYELTVSNVLKIGDFEQVGSPDTLYAFEFVPRESDLTVVMGLLKSMLTREHSLKVEEDSPDERSFLDYLSESRVSLSPQAKDSSLSALQFIHHLQEKRNSSPRRQEVIP